MRELDPERFRQRYGPTALVTGASSGIGRSAALRIAELGLDLVLVARSGPALHDVAGLVQDRGRHAEVLLADLATAEGTQTAARRIEGADVGLLVAAAGFGTTGPFTTSDEADELAMLDVNCGAVLRLTRRAATGMTGRGRGGIVLIGSIVGRQGVPGTASYAASKAWVQVLAEGLHPELRPAGVDVLAALPGPVHTAFGDRAGMTMGAADTADAVAEATLRALGRGPLVTPGRRSRLLTTSLLPVPRRTRTRVLGRVVAAMTTTAARGE